MDDGKRSSLYVTFARGFQRGITQFTPSGYSKPVGSAGLSAPPGVPIFARRHRAKSTFSPVFWFGFILGHLEAISTPFWVILRPFWCHPDPISAPKSASIGPLFEQLFAPKHAILRKSLFWKSTTIPIVFSRAPQYENPNFQLLGCSGARHRRGAAQKIFPRVIP